MRRPASCLAAVLAVAGVVVLTPATHADTRVNVYQDIFGPGSSRVVWAFNWNYRAERTGPPTFACVGRSPVAAQNFIGPGFTSPAAPPWTFNNARGNATSGILPASNCTGGPGEVKTNGNNIFDHTIQSVGVVADGTGAMTVSAYSLAIGNVTAGGLGTLALADSGFAKDSIRVRVSKAGSAVTLSNFAGEIRNNPGTTGQVITNTLVVAVYPDSNAANADVNASGEGALFYGRVFVSDAGAVLTGGFVSGDFIVVRNADGSASVTPKVGLTKSVTVPNLAAAAVVIVVDPVAHREPDPASVPGMPPVAALVLSVLLLASGLWFVHRQRSSRPA